MKRKEATAASRTTSAAVTSEYLFQKWLIAGALLVIPAVLLFLYYRVMFPGLVNESALDYAQVGRNLSEGRGFTTYFLRPLAFTHGGNPLQQPDVTHGPLFPVLLAIAFGAAGAKDTVAAGVSGLFYLLTVPVLFWLGTRVFNRAVGLLAATVFAVNGLMLEYAVSGLPITLYTFLTTCLLLVMYNVAVRTREQEGETKPTLPRMPLVLAGVLTGALYLTDSIFIWVAPVILTAVILLNRARRIPALVLFLLPFVVLTLPWMMRNGMLTGNPIFGLRGMEVWMGTKGYYPGSIAYRMMPDDLAGGVGLFTAVGQKIFFGIGEVIQVFPQISASWMLAFLLPSLLFRFANQATNSMRRVMMYCFLGIMVGSLLFGLEMPLFVALIPAMIVFATAYLLHLTEQAKLPRTSIALLAGLMTMAILVPVTREMTSGKTPSALPDAMAARMLRQNTKPGEVVMSDQPWIVAWYADRPTVWLPAIDGKIKVARSQFPQLRWLFLTEKVRVCSPEWQDLYDLFRRWNIAYIQAKMQNHPLPGALRFDASKPGQPEALKGLLDGLNGFTFVAPASKDTITTGLAALPQS